MQGLLVAHSIDPDSRACTRGSRDILDHHGSVLDWGLSGVSTSPQEYRQGTLDYPPDLGVVDEMNAAASRIHQAASASSSA